MVEFLSSEYVQNLLKDPSTTFAAPDEASQKDYDTKTAPINVTSTSNSRYDIKDIKEDAEWLKKNAGINLVAALRLVMVEFQSRPHHHLTGPLSSHDATNLKEAAGLTSGQGGGNLLDLDGAGTRDADAIQADFDSLESRRHRLFSTYLSERKYFLLTADYVSSIRLYEQFPIHTSLSENPATLYNMKLPTKPKDELETLLENYLHVVDAAMKLIGDGSSAVVSDKLLADDEVEINWLHSFMTEALHALLVVFQLADCFGKDFPPSTAVNHWFLLMENYTFFGAFQAVSIQLLKASGCHIY